MELILASNSPRRRELLEKLGALFTVVLGDFEENGCGLDPIVTAESFAFGKAKRVFDKLENTEKVIVLGSDTVVYHNGEILGKPQNEKQAKKMLSDLSGKTHTVISGYCILGKNIKIVGHDSTAVTFNKLSDLIINDYISSGLYKGKAGSYGIQDGYPLVKEYSGSLNNVIGLPTEKIIPHLKKYGII